MITNADMIVLHDIVRGHGDRNADPEALRRLKDAQ